MDQFGRAVRSRSKDRARRSRSRSRDRDRQSRSRRSRSRSRDSRRSQTSGALKAYSGSYRNRSPKRSRSRSLGRSNRRFSDQNRNRPSRDRKRSSSSSSSSDFESKEHRNLAARVFVGNLPFSQFTDTDLWKLLGVEESSNKIKNIKSFPERGYAFIQFGTKEEALAATIDTKGTVWKGRSIDCKMALSEGGYHDGRRRGTPPPGITRRGGSSPVMGRRGSSPGMGRRGSPPPGIGRRGSSPPGGPMRGSRDRSPMRDRDEGYGHRDPFYKGRDGRREDPYFDDPYRRPLPPDDPYLDRLRDDRYRGHLPPPMRRDPYLDPYRDPIRDPIRDPHRDPPPPPQRALPPPECTVLLATEAIRPFGEAIIRRVKANGLVASIALLPEDRTIPQALDDMTRRGTLFAVVITAQNEVHNSVTLNILHGQPQEHRNMPLDDSMALVARSFDRYTQAAREKAAPPPTTRTAAPPGPAPAPFETPDSGITYLLNLLADNRQLNVAELDKVIVFLTERRKKLAGDATPITPTIDPAATVAAARALMAQEREALAKQEAKVQEAAAIQQRQDLQSKILNLFNGDKAPGAPVMTSALLSIQNQGMSPPRAINTHRSLLAPSGHQSNSALINFDNPSVQKALDSLIQNPQVLQNIASVSGPSQTTNTAGMGSQHRPGQPGIAQTSLSTGGRQPGYGPPGQHFIQQPSRYQNPY